MVVIDGGTDICQVDAEHFAAEDLRSQSGHAPNQLSRRKQLLW